MRDKKDYYIYCMSMPVDIRSAYVKKVKGSYPITITRPVWKEYQETPEMFIHKNDYNEFILSDSKTGLRIYAADKLKDIAAWLDNNDNIVAILERYNTPFILNQKEIFKELVKQAA